ncbi:MAG: hypothetical protein WC979_01100 [Candidatus Pacearchaeota archaeon]|jgi:hypothetical protein|nr:hypothetical protein [Clostridia bacterium]
MIRYIHGSGDSLDIDVFYVFDKLPSFQECKEFCDSSKEENRNIIVIKDGMVTDCYKGTCDEIQNSLITTYRLHEQEFPLILDTKVKRNEILKAVRVLRCFLSHYSKTTYRESVKSALKSHSWESRLSVAETLDLSIDEFGKNSVIEVRKIFAFQLAQALGLLMGRPEIYTKAAAAKEFPELEKYLYRIPTSANYLIQAYKDFLFICRTFDVIQQGDVVNFIHYGTKINLKDEEILK